MIGRGRFITALLFACALAFAPGCVRMGWGGDDRATLERLLQSGNEALRAGQYDEAIRLYDSALARSPGHPSFLSSKSAALRLRGVTRFNAALKLDNERTRAAERETAGQDFRASVAVALEAVKQVNHHGLAGRLQPSDYEQAQVAAYATRAESLRLLASLFDKPRAEEALAAAREYMELEPDAAKRAKMHLGAAKMLLDAGRGEQAAAVYREILAGDADNLDATLGAGLALAQSGDVAKYREAAPYLRGFVERAPDNHPLKAEARDTLEYMNRPPEQPPSRRLKGTVIVGQADDPKHEQ